SDNGDVLWDNYVGRVVSGNLGSLVAWYEYPQSHSPEAVVYDTHAGQVVHRYPVDVPPGVGSGLYAVDSEAVYGFTDLTYGEDLTPTWWIKFDTGSAKSIGSNHYQQILRSHGLART